jgi:exodeoxyribonuclease VII small subunit
MDASAQQLYKLTKTMDHTFESAFERLEQILEKMNTGKSPLDESLKLFEEADQLIRLCSQRLTSAEHKVETLIKNRTNELVLDDSQKPKTQPFARPVQNPMTS